MVRFQSRDSRGFEYSSNGQTMKVSTYRNSAAAVINETLKSDLLQNENFNIVNQAIDTRNVNVSNETSVQNTSTTPTESNLIRNITGSTGNVNFSEFLYSLWQNQKMCDIIIRIDDIEYKAHKLALAACSEKYSTTYCERLPVTFAKVDLSGFSADAVECILRFIYTSELNLDSHNIDPVIGCAKQLGITSALELCKKYLLKYDIQTIFTMWHIAEKYGITDILSQLEFFICNKFSEVFRSSGFLNGQFEQIYYFICKENLHVNSELDIFMASATWIDFNRAERLRYAPELMSCVRFVEISPDDLSTIVETYDHIFRTKECRELLFEAYRYHAIQESEKKLLMNTNSRLRTRSSKNFKHTMTSRTQRPHSAESIHNSYLSDITSKNKRDRTPRLTASPNTKRYNAEPSNYNHEMDKYHSSFKGNPFKHIVIGSALSDHPSLPPRPTTMIAVGGIDPFNTDSDEPCRLVKQYNPTTDNWHMLTYLPEPRHHLGVAMLDGFLYVIGGSIWNEDDPENLAIPTNICFRYDAPTKRWSRIASLRQPRMYLSVCLLEDVLYALGGNDSYGRSLNTVEYYDPDANAWEVAAPMYEEKIGAAAVGYKGQLFVAGGFQERGNRMTVLNSVECHDPKTDSWIRRNPLPIACCHANLVEAKGNLYLLGGSTMTPRSTCNSLSTVFYYSERDDSWIHLQNMHTARHDAGVTAIDSRIYVVGGMNSEEGRGLQDMECLDVDHMTWMEGLATLSHTALGIACCSFEDEEVA